MDEDSTRQIRHDVRAPLNQIIGYSDLLREEANEQGLPRFAADLERIRSAARRLNAMLDQFFESPDQPAARACTAPTLGDAASEVARAEQHAASASPATSASAPPPVRVEHPSLEAREAAVAVMQVGRILVVDDDEANRDFLSRRLESRGFTVDTAPDGSAAIGKIAMTAYDLVLLDVLMEFPRFRGHPARRDTPEGVIHGYS